MVERYLLSGRCETIGDEVHVHGDAGGGTIAFKRAAVTMTDAGIEVPADAAPRLVTPPQGVMADTEASAEVGVETLEGLYCICIGQACYTYQCSDNKYLGQCFPVPCAYYGCKSGDC